MKKWTSTYKPMPDILAYRLQTDESMYIIYINGKPVAGMHNVISMYTLNMCTSN